VREHLHYSRNSFGSSKKKIENVKLVAGGIIPPADVIALKELV